MRRYFSAAALSAAWFAAVVGNYAFSEEPAATLVGLESAKKALSGRKPCKLAVGFSTLDQKSIESRIICVAEIVKDADTIDEDLGCSMVLYDLNTLSYRAGKSNLKIATRRACDAQGLARLDPKPFTEYALRDGVTAKIIHSESETIKTWWEGHLATARAARPPVVPSRPKTAPKRKKKGGWSYDKKSQFEGM